MIKFKKDINAKIMAVSLVLVFFMQAVVYGDNLPDRCQLRKPLMFRYDPQRMQGGANAVTGNDVASLASSPATLPEFRNFSFYLLAMSRLAVSEILSAAREKPYDQRIRNALQRFSSSLLTYASGFRWYPTETIKMDFTSDILRENILPVFSEAIMYDTTNQTADRILTILAQAYSLASNSQDRNAILYAVINEAAQINNPKVDRMVLRFIVNVYQTPAGAISPIDKILASPELYDYATTLSIKEGFHDWSAFIEAYKWLRERNVVLSGVMFNRESRTWQNLISASHCEKIRVLFQRFPVDFLKGPILGVALGNFENNNAGWTHGDGQLIFLNESALSDEVIWHEYVGHILIERTFDIKDWMWVLYNHGWRIFMPKTNILLKVTKTPSGRLAWKEINEIGHLEIVPADAYTVNDILNSQDSDRDFYDPATEQYMNIVRNSIEVESFSPKHRSRGNYPGLAMPILGVNIPRRISYLTSPEEDIAYIAGWNSDYFLIQEMLQYTKVEAKTAFEATHPGLPAPTTLHKPTVDLFNFFVAKLTLLEDQQGQCYMVKCVRDEAHTTVMTATPNARSQGVDFPIYLPISREQYENSIYRRFRQLEDSSSPAQNLNIVDTIRRISETSRDL